MFDWLIIGCFIIEAINMYVFYWLLANHSPDIACLVFSTYFLSILKNLGGVSDNAGGSNNLDLS